MNWYQLLKASGHNIILKKKWCNDNGTRILSLDVMKEYTGDDLVDKIKKS